MNEQTLRSLCTWPGVTWDIKWGDDLVGSVAGKMFCVRCDAGRADGPVCFKVPVERFLELTDQPGFRPAPYLARAHWLSVDDPAALDEAALRGYLRQSYELVRARLPKRQQRELAD